jgi:hypothetical protein
MKKQKILSATCRDKADRGNRTQYLFYGKRNFPAAVTAARAFLAVVPEGPDADSVRKLMAEAQQQGATGAPLIPKAR